MAAEKLPKAALESIMVRVTSGERIAVIAQSYGIHPAGLLRRLGRFFPVQMEKARKSGSITTKRSGSGVSALEAMKKLIEDPAVQEILNNKGSYQSVGAKYNVPTTTLFKRVKKLRAFLDNDTPQNPAK